MTLRRSPSQDPGTNNLSSIAVGETRALVLDAVVLADRLQGPASPGRIQISAGSVNTFVAYSFFIADANETTSLAVQAIDQCASAPELSARALHSIA